MNINLLVKYKYYSWYKWGFTASIIPGCLGSYNEEYCPSQNGYSTLMAFRIMCAKQLWVKNKSLIWETSRDRVSLERVPIMKDVKTFLDRKLNPWSSIYHPGHPHCFSLCYVSSSVTLGERNEDDSKRKKSW